jgi:hypothetical protein
MGKKSDFLDGVSSQAVYNSAIGRIYYHDTQRLSKSESASPFPPPLQLEQSHHTKAYHSIERRH